MPRSKARYSPLFEALEAARWRGLSDAEYDALAVDEKARVLAHYRVHTHLRAVVEWEQAKELRRSRGRKPS